MIMYMHEHSEDIAYACMSACYMRTLTTNEAKAKINND